jgi:integrase
MSPFISADQPTLAYVLQTVEANAELKPGRRSQLCSSVRAVGRVLGLPLDAIPAHKRWLRSRLADAAPRLAGLSPKRFANARSDLWAALSVAGIGRGRRAYLAPLSPDWQALWNTIASDHLRWRLKRFMSFFSAIGIVPGVVDETSFALFRTELDEEGWVDNPERSYRSAINSWNTARQTVPGWPARLIALPDLPKRGWTLAFEAFPSTFQADVEKWRSVFSGDDDLADEGPARKPRASTVRHRLFQIRMAASALVLRGHAVEGIASLAYLVEVEHFKDIVRFMIDRQGKPTEAIHGLATGLLAIARHHVKAAPAQLEALRRIVKKLDLEADGFREKTRDRLLQFDDPKNLFLLLDLPRRLLELAREIGPPDRKAARLVQMAVAIELLIFTGLRIDNLARIDIEAHLKWVRVDRREVLHVDVPREVAKNHRRVDHELAEDSVDLIRLYLARYRPLLLAVPGTALFPGRYGGSKKSGAFSNRITRIIRQHAGLVVNAHLFRSLAGKIHLREHPGDYVTIKEFLGHSSIETTTESYTQFEAQAARRHYQETVRRLRDELPPIGKVRGRRRKRPKPGGGS